MTDANLTPATRETPWPVALVSQKIRDYIDRLGTIWVEGELTQWHNRSGNIYGKLKDLNDDATVSITVWRSVSAKLDETFNQGDHVVALVKANYWVKGGTLTMQVLNLKHMGLGDLLERIERLRKKLHKEGLFDHSRKKPLPFLPQKIGLITGQNSDAEKDVIRNAVLRWPGVQFEVRHSAVQGDRAASELLNALQQLEADPTVDVIIFARGGGDFQHLLPFSDEALIRAVAAATTPVVSAIGHEADRPLLDEAADLRASTPTDAAKRVVPDVSEQLAGIDEARSRLSRRLSDLLSTESDRIAQMLNRPVLSNPARIVDERAEELTRWIARGTELADRSVDDAQRQVKELKSRLTALSPQGTLDRGYSIAQLLNDAVLRDPQQATEGTHIRLTLAGGKLGATSTGTENPQNS